LPPPTPFAARQAVREAPGHDNRRLAGVKET
jgi:hypothetical protein